eukprot:11257541-Prorocentrum_lima.AAC.1
MSPQVSNVLHRWFALPPLEKAIVCGQRHTAPSQKGGEVHNEMNGSERAQVCSEQACHQYP